MKICPNCNSKANDDSQFCSGCGFHFEERIPKNNASGHIGMSRYRSLEFVRNKLFRVISLIKNEI